MVKVQYTMEILRKNQRKVGKQTFRDSGLNLVLLAACQKGSLDVVKHFLDNHMDLFDINEEFTYGYHQEWYRPVNYVTIIEDVIGFIDEGKETRTHNLLEFVRTYCKTEDSSQELIQTLQRYGAR